MNGPEPRRGRLSALDGLRGWLALTVVLSHVAGWRWLPIVPGHAPAPDHLTWILWNLGAPAVDAFFVLSGLVVGRSLLARPRPYHQYLRERAARLLPVGAFGLVLGLALHALAPQLAAQPMREMLTAPLRPGDWAGVLTLGLWPFTANRLNPPLWSLIIEQHIALVMPVLTLLMTSPRLSGVGRTLTVSGAALAGLLLAILGVQPGYSLWFVPAFALGVAIRNVRLSPAWAWTLIALGGAVWQHRMLTGDNLLFRQTGALGAALLIAGLCNLPTGAWLRRGLESRLSQWLGRVSYSLYATHFPVLAVGAWLLPDPAWLGAALMVLPALGAAQLVWLGIERPGAAWKTVRRPFSEVTP